MKKKKILLFPRLKKSSTKLSKVSFRFKSFQVFYDLNQVGVVQKVKSFDFNVFLGDDDDKRDQ